MSIVSKSRSRVAGLRPTTWGLCLFGLLLGYATTVRWALPGQIIASGDYFPLTLINPGLWWQRERYAWLAATGLGAPGSQLPYVPLTIVNQVLRIVLTPGEAQQAVFALLYAAQFLAMVFLVLAIMPGHRLAACCAGIFYCFNPFIVLADPNPFSVFALAYPPYMAGLLVRAVMRPASRKLWLLWVLSACLSGYLVVNPPAYALFVAFLIAVAAYLIWIQRRCASARRRVIVLGLLFIAANVYWAIPYASSILGAGQQNFGAVTQAQNYSFVAQRSSILNMFWLNPTWGWNYAIYFPFAPAYNAPVLLIAVFVPALLAFSTLLNRTIPSPIALPAASVALVLLFLSTGLHQPWQAVNLFLFQHVPLYWLFREPDTKFPVYLLLLYAPLIGCQVAWLSNQVARAVSRPLWITKAVRLGVLTMLGLTFALTAFPLWTGAFVNRWKGGDTWITTHVSVPKYWFELSDFLTRHDPTARILLLPNDNFYQVTYDWGYHGADLVPTELLANPTITLSGGQNGYETPSLIYDAFNRTLLQLMQSGGPQSMAPYLAAQGVSLIVQRNDVDTSGSSNQVLSPYQVRMYLRRQSDIHFLRSFGKLDLYTVDQRQSVAPVYGIPMAPPDLTGPEAVWQQRANRRVMEALGLPLGTTYAAAPPRQLSPHVLKVAWTQQNPARYIVRVDATAGPVLLVLSAIYNPNWHACLVPAGNATPPWVCWFGGYIPATKHMRPLGFANGWLIDHPGRYTVIIDYGFQHVADLAILVSALAIMGVLGWALWPHLRGVRLGAHDPRHSPAVAESAGIAHMTDDG